MARLIVPASPPDVPTFPRKMLILGSALVVGLALGLGGAWAREQLNGGFITSREAEEQLGLPLLVSIGRGARDADGDVTPHPPQSPVAA